MKRDTEVLHFCPFCGNENSVKIALEDFVKWENGELVQNAFPYLNATEREQFISGMCPDCQKRVFGDEEDADECLAESLASTGQWW
jgi:predicted RNA-binding Zn-ribbon protein involved in translation (DUF1610 family)